MTYKWGSVCAFAFAREMDFVSKGSTGRTENQSAVEYLMGIIKAE